MKTLIRITLDIVTAPLLLVLFCISFVGHAAHAAGRFVVDTIETLGN